MKLLRLYKRSWENLVNFEGRASRAEFLTFVLFTEVGIGILGLVVRALFPTADPAAMGFLLLLPQVASISVSVRRYHDSNRSGWWLLLIPVFLIGIIPLLFSSGDRGRNRYGAPPHM